MRVWHKMLVAPVVAILFLLALGGLSVAMMARQGLTVASLIKNRGGAMEMALGSSQDVSQVHSGAYRVLAWSGELGEEKTKAASAQQLARVDVVAKRVTEFRERAELVAEERALVDAVLPKIASYRKAVDGALHLALSNPSYAKVAM